MSILEEAEERSKVDKARVCVVGFSCIVHVVVLILAIIYGSSARTDFEQLALSYNTSLRVCGMDPYVAPMDVYELKEGAAEAACDGDPSATFLHFLWPGEMHTASREQVVSDRGTRWPWTCVGAAAGIIAVAYLKFLLTVNKTKPSMFRGNRLAKMLWYLYILLICITIQVTTASYNAFQIREDTVIVAHIYGTTNDVGDRFERALPLFILLGAVLFCSAFALVGACFDYNAIAMCGLMLVLVGSWLFVTWLAFIQCTQVGSAINFALQHGDTESTDAGDAAAKMAYVALYTILAEAAVEVALSIAALVGECRDGMRRGAAEAPAPEADTIGK